MTLSEIFAIVGGRIVAKAGATERQIATLEKFLALMGNPTAAEVGPDLIERFQQGPEGQRFSRRERRLIARGLRRLSIRKRRRIRSVADGDVEAAEVTKRKLFNQENETMLQMSAVFVPSRNDSILVVIPVKHGDFIRV